METHSLAPITTAVFLLAGKGVRMMPLTADTPKPMLDLCGKPLVVHTLDSLPETVTDLVFVVGYLQEKIRSYFGDTYHGKHVHYVAQDEARGTAHALFLCKETLFNIGADRFFVAMGDDIYCNRDIQALEETGTCAVLVQETTGTSEAPVAGGNVVFDETGAFVRIDEGQHTGTVRINAALYVLTPDIFTYEPVAIRGGTEYGLPQTMVTMLPHHPIAVVSATKWIHITDTHDLERARAATYTA